MQQEFLDLYGNIRLSEILSVMVFLKIAYEGFKWVYAQFKAKYKKEETTDTAITNATKLPDFHKESIKERARLDGRLDKIEEDNLNQFNEIRRAIDSIVKRLDEADERQRKKDLSDTQTSLLQAYQYYTNPKRNPMQAWTSLEKKSFMDAFEIYKSKGGDGYMDENVAPAMATLIEIPMSDENGTNELRTSRNLIYDKI